jgi:hypothetical protein
MSSEGMAGKISQHAQWAMYGVAQFLPGKDQHDFMAAATARSTNNYMHMAGVTNVASSDDVLPQQQSNLWLTAGGRFGYSISLAEGTIHVGCTRAAVQ